MRHEKIAKALKLVHSLASSADGLSLDEMAQVIESNRRTAERYRDVLLTVFPQIEEWQDGRIKRFRIRGGLSDFLNAPNLAELDELEMAARGHENAGDLIRAELLQSLKRKILSALRPDLRRRFDTDLDALIRAEGFVMQAGPRPIAPSETLALLRRALLSSQCCLFDYASAKGITRRREVAPYGVLYGKTYFLVGPEVGKPDPVLWRLDRITGLSLSDRIHPPREDFRLDAFAARSFGTFQEDEEEIKLSFSPAAAPDAARYLFHPSQAMRKEPDGSLTVEFRAGGLLELVRHLFTWGSTVSIVAPEKLKSLMISELETALKATKRAGSSPGGTKSLEA